MISARNAIQEITINAMPTIFLYPVPTINGKIRKFVPKSRKNSKIYVKNFYNFQKFS